MAKFIGHTKEERRLEQQAQSDLDYIQRLCSQNQKLDQIFVEKNRVAQLDSFNKLKVNLKQKKLLTKIIKQSHLGNLKQKFQRWKIMHFKIL